MNLNAKISTIKSFYLLVIALVGLAVVNIAAQNNQNKLNRQVVKQAPEDFDEFLNKFANDPDFQISRVVFPIKQEVLNTSSYQMEVKTISKKEWRHKPLPVLKMEYRIQYYDNFNRQFAFTDERVLSIEGNGNGIDYSMYFKAIDGVWFLVKIIDKSS